MNARWEIPVGTSSPLPPVVQVTLLTRARIKASQLFFDFAASGFGLATAIVIGLCVLFVVIATPIRDISHNVGIGRCHIEARQFERPTKFVDVNWFSWDCYVQLPSGTWIKDDQYRGFAR